MTFTEILVIAGGLVLGYWLVSVLLPTLFQGKNKSPNPEPGPHSWNEPSGAGTESSSSHRPKPDETSTPLKWFEILGIDETASAKEIDLAYKTQISQYHPDKVARMGIEIRKLAETRSKAINAAYNEAMSGR